MEHPVHRAIVHVDLDAFYAQVEQKAHPQLRGKPTGVVQYNPYGDLADHAPEECRIVPSSNGSLIAVSYEARASGVKRNMRGDQARAACPEIQLVQVPTKHGKADLTLYRREGRRVLEVLSRLAGAVERASIDECYLDLTEEAQRRLHACAGAPPLPPSPEQVHVMQEAGFEGAASWWQRPSHAWRPGERLLACAAAAVAELRAAVHAELGYTCSAGVAHTKLMAKLCSGLHKPAQQTVLPASAVPALLGPLPIPKLKGLGGKFGEQASMGVMTDLGIETVGQLAATPPARLAAAFGERDARWLEALARGVTEDAVEARKLPKSVNCGKTFRGKHSLRGIDAVHKWLLELGGELSERLEEDREDNNRVPQLLTVNFAATLPWEAAPQGGFQTPAEYHSTSRSCALRKWDDAAAIAADATALVRRWASEQGPGWQISSLFITAGSFVPVPSAASAITRFFKPAAQQQEQQQEEKQQQEQPQQPPPPEQQQEQLPGSSTEPDAAGPSGSRQQQEQPLHLRDGSTAVGAGSSTSSGRGPFMPAAARPSWQQQGQQQQSPQGQQQQQLIYQGAAVDPAVLAELPPELQREIRAQAKAAEMTARLQDRRPAAGRAGGRGGRGGSKRPASGAGGQPSIDAFLKGKQPKR